MPVMLTGENLRAAVQAQTFLKGGEVASAEGVKYDFHLSSRILKASFGRPIDMQELTAAERAMVSVEPGEMVFVLSQESLKLPANMMADLSQKRKMSHAGILSLGGFRIDPRYEGRLLLGLYNFSSTRFPLIPGKKLIAATFYELAPEEIGQFPEPAAPMDDFPDELIQTMQKYSPVSVASVKDIVEKLRVELDTLRNDLRSNEAWYGRIKETLDRHDKQIGDLLNGLTAEQDARKSGQQEISRQLSGIDGQLKNYGWLLPTVVGLLIALVGAVITLLFIRH